MIPFPISDVTRSSNPLKLREYLAAGLPVVSTAIPEVEATNACLIGHDADEFAARVREAMTIPGPTVARSDAVLHESWEARLAEIGSYITQIGSRSTCEAVKRAA
jgi:hypothetical protein